MGKIGDLWARLGLKKDDFSRGIKEAERESTSFGGSISAMSSKAKIAFAAVAAAIVGVINAVKDLAKQNQALGDAWNRMASGMAASWDTFKTAVANMNFSNLLSDMREANRLARDLYDAQDALGEIGTAYNISLSKQMNTINELRGKLSNLTLSDQERVKAGEDLLKIYEDLEKNPTRGLFNVSEASLDKIAGKLGYQLKGASEEALAATRREVEDFFIWLGSEAGEAWNKAYAEAASDPTKLLGTNMEAQRAGLTDNQRALLFNYQRNVGEKDRLAMEEAVVAYYQQEAKYSGETLRIQRQINGIKAGMTDGKAGGGGSVAAPKPKEIDAFQQELALIKQESAELAEVREADEASARAANEAYEAWRKTADLEPVKPFDDDMLMALERGLHAAEEMGNEMEDLKKKSEQLSQSIADELVSAIEDGLVGAFDALANVIGGVTEGGMEEVAKALLEPLADMAIKAGTLIMMSGEAIQALKDSLVGFFGGNAIVAGAALVAVGIAAKAGLAAIGNRGGSAGSVSRYGSEGSIYGGAGGVSTAELTVNVVGTVKGSDIILSGDNTLKNWSR